MRGPPSCRATQGAGAGWGQSGPRPGPSPEERREPCLPGLGEAHFRGEGGTASLCRPHDPRTLHPTPPGLHPRCPSPGRFGKTLSGPSALLRRGPRNRQAGRRRGGARRPPDPRCDLRAPLYLAARGALWDFAAAGLVLLPAVLLAVTGCILCLGTDFRWCDPVTAVSPARALWVAQIASICSRNKHRLRLGWFDAQFLPPGSFRRWSLSRMVAGMALFTPLTAGGMALSFFVLPRLLKRR